MTLRCLIPLLLATPLAAQPISLKPIEDLDWQTTPEGVAFAQIEGDRFAEAYHAMVRLPSGTTSPLHVKSARMVGLMIEGEMRHFAGTEREMDASIIGPGAWYAIPAGLAHVSACVSDTPCVTYLFQDGAFDFLPVAQ